MNVLNNKLLLFLVASLLLLGSLATPTFAQDRLDEKKEQLAEEMDGIGKRIEENRLIHREPADIVAWVFMGILVGALAGTFSPLGTSVVARLLRLGLGLAGALVGGMVVRVWDIDFGWPIIEIPLVEALFSLLGAIALVFLIRGGTVYLARRARGKLIKPITGRSH